MTREEARLWIIEHWGNDLEDGTKQSEVVKICLSALSENKGEFDEMTNGEVMNHVLRKTFPRIIFIRGIDERNKTKSIVYSEEWENAPYQKGGE